MGDNILLFPFWDELMISCRKLGKTINNMFTQPFPNAEIPLNHITRASKVICPIMRPPDAKLFFHFENFGDRVISANNYDEFSEKFWFYLIKNEINNGCCFIKIEGNGLCFTFIPWSVALTLRSDPINPESAELLLSDSLIAKLPFNSEGTKYNVSLPKIDQNLCLPKNFITDYNFRVHAQICLKIYTQVENSDEVKFDSIKFIYPSKSNQYAPKHFNAVYIFHPQNGIPLEVKYPFEISPESTISGLAENGTTVTVRLQNYMEIVFIVKNMSSIVSYASQDVKVLISSFGKKISDTGSRQKSLLINFICQSMDMFLSGKFYAPFTSICQSSGTGKTRLILECADSLPMIYGVFRADSDRSYPPQSQWISKFYEYVTSCAVDDFDSEFAYQSAESCQVGRVLIFILKLLETFKAICDILVKEKGLTPFQAIMNVSSWFSTNEGQAAFSTFIDISKIEGMFTVDRITEDIQNLTFHYNEIVSNSMENTLQRKDLPFVLVFDEITLLFELPPPNNIRGTNLFFIIRRALHFLNSNTKLLCLGIGTNCDITVLHRSVNDNSLRFIDRKLLLPPFVLASNWNVFEKELDLDMLVINVETVKSKRFLNLLCSFGRALWSSLPFERVLEIAAKKLINGCDDGYETSMAIWGIRTALSMNADLQLIKTLVHSYIATILSVKYGIESMYVSYPSDPILAIAARKILNTVSKFEPIPFFNALLRYIQGRPIDKGGVVESIFSQIILLAIDRSSNHSSSIIDLNANNGNKLLQSFFDANNFLLEKLLPKDLSVQLVEKTGADKVSYSEIIRNYGQNNNLNSSGQRYNLNSLYFSKYYHLTTVSDFLSNLCGTHKQKVIETFLAENRTLSGFINASYVIYLNDSFPYEKIYSDEDLENMKAKVLKKASKYERTNLIDRALLRYAFIRSAMLKMPPSYFGYDLVIPVLVERQTEETKGDDIFTFIGVQFKSYFENSFDVIDKMHSNLHYVQCPQHSGNNCPASCSFATPSEDLKVIYDHQITIYMSAKPGDILIPKLSRDENVPVRAAKLIADEKIGLLNENEFIINSERQSCIVISSLSELVGNGFFDEELYSKIKEIIHYRETPLDNSESYSKLLTADGMICTQSNLNPNVDPAINRLRGLEPVSMPLGDGTELKDWTMDSLQTTIDSYALNYPKFKLLDKDFGLKASQYK